MVAAKRSGCLFSCGAYGARIDGRRFAAAADDFFKSLQPRARGQHITSDESILIFDAYCRLANCPV